MIIDLPETNLEPDQAKRAREMLVADGVRTEDMPEFRSIQVRYKGAHGRSKDPAVAAEQAKRALREGRVYTVTLNGAEDVGVRERCAVQLRQLLAQA